MAILNTPKRRVVFFKIMEVGGIEPPSLTNLSVTSTCIVGVLILNTNIGSRRPVRIQPQKCRGKTRGMLTPPSAESLRSSFELGGPPSGERYSLIKLQVRNHWQIIVAAFLRGQPHLGMQLQQHQPSRNLDTPAVYPYHYLSSITTLPYFAKLKITAVLFIMHPLSATMFVSISKPHQKITAVLFIMHPLSAAMLVSISKPHQKITAIQVLISYSYDDIEYI